MFQRPFASYRKQFKLLCHLLVALQQCDLPSFTFAAFRFSTKFYFPTHLWLTSLPIILIGFPLLLGIKALLGLTRLPPPASLTQLPPNSAPLLLPQLLKNFIPPHISGHWHMRFPSPGTFSHTPSHPCQMSVQKSYPLKSLLRTFCKGHVLYKLFHSTVIRLKQISHLHDY